MAETTEFFNKRHNRQEGKCTKPDCCTLFCLHILDFLSKHTEAYKKWEFYCVPRHPTYLPPLTLSRPQEATITSVARIWLGAEEGETVAGGRADYFPMGEKKKYRKNQQLNFHQIPVNNIWFPASEAPVGLFFTASVPTPLWLLVKPSIHTTFPKHKLLQ